MDVNKLASSWWLGCALGLVFSLAASADVVFQDNFQSSKLNLDKWEEHGGCYPYSFKVIQDPCSGKSNNRVVRIINRMGEDNRTCKKSSFGRQVTFLDGTKGYKRRAELVPKPKTTRAVYNKDLWAAIRIRLDDKWPKTQPSDRMIIAQIIPIFKGQSGTDMKLFIDTKQRWGMEIRTSQKGKKTIDIGPIKRGAWTNWTLHYKRSKGSGGVAQLWQNGKKVVDYKGPTTYTNNELGQFKPAGMYVSKAKNKSEYIAYFDDIKIAQGANQYDQVKTSKAASACTDSVLLPPKILQIEKVKQNDKK